jgi:hypothetical protein
LPAPDRVGISQALDIEAARQAPFNGGFDEFWRKESERKRQVHLPHGALLPLRQLLDIGLTSNYLVQPEPTFCNSIDEANTPLCALGSSILSDRSMRQEDFPESFRWRLLPTNEKHFGIARLVRRFHRNDQFCSLHLDSRDERIQHRVMLASCGRQHFMGQVLPECRDDRFLDLGGGDPGYRSKRGGKGLAM